MVKFRKTVMAIGVASALASVVTHLQPAIAAEKPNFVTIVIDDMGYSDIGVFGNTEVETPNLDELANSGIQLTKFYAAPTSTPSRAQFFTGRDTHTTGVGNMEGFMRDEQRGHPGYSGVLDPKVTIFPELLKENGYHTMMVGKWDLGETSDYYPIEHGFDQTNVLLPGGDVHYLANKDGSARYTFSNELVMSLTSYHPGYYDNLNRIFSLYNKNGVEITQLDFFEYTQGEREAYSTIYYTDMAIDMLDRWKAEHSDQPFYLNVSHIGVHFPLQAPDCDENLHEQFQDACTDKYFKYYLENGWQVIREQRFNKQKQLGLIPENAELPPIWEDVIKNISRAANIPESDLEGKDLWQELSEAQRIFRANKMAIYATMVEILDQEVGRLVQHLKDIGEYENTVFFIFSDNGAAFRAPAQHIKGSRREFIDNNMVDDNNVIKVTQDGTSELVCDNGKAIDEEGNIICEGLFDRMGNAGSYHEYLKAWSMVSNTPWQLHKSTTFEGGIRTPAIIHYAGLPQQKVGKPDDCTHSEMDIAPTILEMAGIVDPDTTQRLSQGTSMAGLFDGSFECNDSKRVLGWEMNGIKGLAYGDLRLAQKNNSDENFYLYDLATDPFQLTDLKESQPEQYQEMLALYAQYEEDNGVIPVSNLKLRFLGTESDIEKAPVFTGGFAITNKNPTLFHSKSDQRTTVTSTDKIKIATQIRPKKEHVNTPGNQVFVHAQYTLADGKEVYYGLNQEGKIVIAANQDELPFYKTDTTLEKKLFIPVFDGSIGDQGTLDIWFGYITSDGTVFMNDPEHFISLNITKAEG